MDLVEAKSLGIGMVIGVTVKSRIYTLRLHKDQVINILLLQNLIEIRLKLPVLEGMIDQPYDKFL